MSEFPLPRYPTIRDCLAAVSNEFGIGVLDLVSERRMISLARPRQVAYWLARMATPKSLPEIGRQIGRRDHATIIHGIRVVEKLRETEPEFRQVTDRLLGQLRQAVA